MKAAFLGCAVLVGFALSAAACSDMNQCSSKASAGAGGTSCVAGNASGGSGGSSATCTAWTAYQACLSTFCKTDGVGTPFCNCFLKGYDLSPPVTDTNGNESGCACVAANPADFCMRTQAQGIDGSSVDCSAASGQVASLCVGVQ